MELGISTNAGAVAIRFREAGPVMARHVLQAMRDIGLHLQGVVRRDKLRGQALNTRTGTLGRAIFSRVEVIGTQEIQTRVGADLAKAAYGRIQELGGTIRPKRARHLAIPIGAALTASGVARMSARQFIQNPAALGFAGSFVSRSGRAIMGVRSGRGAGVEPVFALANQVTLKPRRYLSSALDEQRGWILQRIGVAAQAGIQEVAGAGPHG